MKHEEMTAAKDSFERLVRLYSESQHAVWQLVPWLALQADGRDGGMGFYRSSYEDGYWRILLSSSDPYTNPYIDCATGKIYEHTSELVCASYQTVLRLSCHLHYLNAEALCNRLRAIAAQQRASWISEQEAEHRQRERETIAEQFSLSADTPFTRKVSAVAA